jgi:hypothetical protein
MAQLRAASEGGTSLLLFEGILMAFANPAISDIMATTIESRTRQLADNVTNNNAVLKRLSERGRIKTFSGGARIMQELSFAENSNAGWYSGLTA